MHEHSLGSVPIAPRREWLLPGLAVGVVAAGVAVCLEPLGLLIAFAAVLLVAVAWWAWGGYDRWFVAFAIATCLLPPLPIALGTTGPHVAIGAAFLGLWMGLAHLTTWRIRNDLLTISLIAFWLVLGLSVSLAAINAPLSVAAIGAARLGLLGISVYAFFYFAYCPPGNSTLRLVWWIKLLFGLAVTGAGFACVDFYFQWPPPAGFGEQFVWLIGVVYRRAQGFFYEASTLGNFCAFFLLLVGTIWVRRDSRPMLLSPWILAAGAIVLATALLFSFSRSSLLALMVSACALLFLERRHGRVGRWFAVASAGVIGVLVLTYVLAPEFTEAYLLRLWLTATGILHAPDVWSSGRWTNWSLLLNFLAEHPQKLLLGIGYATLPHTDLLGRPIVGDNMYLSMLVETGILGVAAMGVFLAALLSTAYRVSRSKDAMASLVGTWLFCFWVGQLAQMLSVDVLTFWRVLPLYLGLLGMAAYRANRSARAEPAT
jgi:hypothetical protein